MALVAPLPAAADGGRTILGLLITNSKCESVMTSFLQRMKQSAYCEGASCASSLPRSALTPR